MRLVGTRIGRHLRLVFSVIGKLEGLVYAYCSYKPERIGIVRTVIYLYPRLPFSRVDFQRGRTQLSYAPGPRSLVGKLEIDGVFYGDHLCSNQVLANRTALVTLPVQEL